MGLAATRFERFVEVAALPDGELRELLGGADEVARVWAAWELALRLGQRVGPTLAAVADEAPEPGVRRQLAVVLAGLGELDVLMTMAASDPEPEVRATAARYLVRLAPMRADVWGRVAHLLGDLASDVRQMVAEELPADAPAELLHMLHALVEDPSAEVRDLVVARLELLPEGAALPVGVRRQILVEKDEALRVRLMRVWAERHGLPSLLAHVVGAGARVVGSALAIAEEQRAGLSWAAVAPLLRDADPAISDAIVRLFQPDFEDVPFEVFLAHVAKPRPPRYLWYPYIRAFGEHLARVRELTDEQRATLDDLGVRLRERIDRSLGEDDEDAVEDMGWLADLAHLVAAIERVLASEI